MPKYKLNSGKFSVRNGGIATPGDVVEISDRQAEVFNANHANRFTEVGYDEEVTVDDGSGPDSLEEVAEEEDLDGYDGTPSAFFDEYNANEARHAIAAGDVDANLKILQRIEEDRDSPRKTVMGAIEDRLEELGVET